MTLNPEQEQAYRACAAGKNVFLTGPPGTGKSYTLNYIIDYFKRRGTKLGIAASTGCAAVLIGGTTLHSFLKVGLARGSALELAEKTKKKQKKKVEQLKNLEVLVVDEISMIDSAFFCKIGQYLKHIRSNDKPFGGLQVVLVGDFYQLSPVDGKYAFENSIWTSLDLHTIKLTECIRQSGDLIFQRILTEVREGVVSKETLSILKNCSGLENTADLNYTKLYSINVDVDAINQTHYAKVQEKLKPPHIKREFRNGDKTSVELCKGCQIMITHNINIDAGLVNGTKGIVTYIDPTFNSELVTIRLASGSVVVISMFQITDDNDPLKKAYDIMPLKLAWATTIHKSQGATIELLEIDLGRSIFAYGQAYTALSRAVSLEPLRITDISKYSFKTDPKVIEFYKNLVVTDSLPDLPDEVFKEYQSPSPSKYIQTTSKTDTGLKINKIIQTECGHIVRINHVNGSGSKNSGKWGIKITGPSVKKKWRQLFCEPDITVAEKTYMDFLNPTREKDILIQDD